MSIPRAVLSEALRERLESRHLIAAVFTTFEFEPGFFEGEILPVFFDEPLSNDAGVRRVQLDDLLRAMPRRIAVYYDRNGLRPSEQPAKLDIQRQPIGLGTGIFHPKNVFALVEDATEGDTPASRTLIVGCLSANLTESGWWRNVEVAHFEEIRAGSHTNLRDELLSYLDALVQLAERQRVNDKLRERHLAVFEIREFLRATTQRQHRTVNERLQPHFHHRGPLVDFLEGAVGSSLRGCCMEIISPFFDDADRLAPLVALLDRFAPRETRILLPRNPRGEARCRVGAYDWVHSLDDVTWGKLPVDLTNGGASAEARARNVHAKVIRFFEPKAGGRELLYVGSTNLTSPGCSGGGNRETGFLVETTAGGKPSWWLEQEHKRPAAFSENDGEGDLAASGGTPLALRFHWDSGAALAFWDAETPSGGHEILHANVLRFAVPPLAPRVWTALHHEAAEALRGVLATTPLLRAMSASGESGDLLVQEEGMAHRPSLTQAFTVAQILEYWSRLTAEDRHRFLEAYLRAEGERSPLIVKLAKLPNEETLFSRFAGIFHGFESMEKAVREALAEGRERVSDYRVFGAQYDSLGTLLARTIEDVEREQGDVANHFVIALCAKQLLSALGHDFPDYWRSRKAAVKRLEAQLAVLEPLRRRLTSADPLMGAFLEWYEPLFVRRAEKLQAEGQG